MKAAVLTDEPYYRWFGLLLKHTSQNEGPNQSLLEDVRTSRIGGQEVQK